MNNYFKKSKKLQKLGQELNLALKNNNYSLIIKKTNEAIRQYPTWPEAWLCLAAAQYAKGEIQAAYVSQKRAAELNPDNVEWRITFLHYQLEARQDRNKALSQLLELFALHASDTEISLKIALALVSTKSPEVTVSALKWHRKHHPENEDMMALLAMELIKSGEVFEGCQIYQQLILRDKKNIICSETLCIALNNVGAFEASAAIAEAALSALPNLKIGLLNSYGLALVALNRSNDAAAAFRELLSLTPNNRPVMFNLGLALLKAGQFRDGWRYAEYVTEEFCTQTEKCPWRGERSIRGKTLLLLPDQGLGDTIQFLRYVPFLERSGADIVLSVPDPLKRITSSIVPQATVIGLDTSHIKYDVSCPYLSLPVALEEQLGTNIPSSVPYLRPREETIQRMGQFLPPKKHLRVGFVWSGATRKHLGIFYKSRSSTLEGFRPILENNNIDFISLQLGDNRQELLNWSGPFLHDPMDHVTDMEDTAGLMTHLDLIVSVDTSCAHLAGAIGKPVWMITRSDCCWRWQENRNDSPWYPTMRIFRSYPGSLTHAIREVASALPDFVTTHQSRFLTSPMEV
ncbi:hypothetical protein [Acetobacter conturbans]|uniref:Peptide transporter n=1 Tax=Acetobacter conturbans TaxID=1737472 RepID=A0ABX0K1D5_9PROT|nr:hypothetical protein [Acetobacter conturbans]NHN88480.1 hypothetical protein [Acetobacter conturbans]